MTTEVDIANMACALMGSRSQITGINPPSPTDSIEAIYAGVFYDQTRQNLLRAAQWGFARYQVQLDQIGDAIPDNTSPYPWLWEYAYPTDCIKLRYLLQPPLIANLTNNLALTPGAYAIGPNWMPSRSNRFLVASDTLQNTTGPTWYTDGVSTFYANGEFLANSSSLYGQNGLGTYLTLSSVSALLAANYFGLSVTYPAGPPPTITIATNNSVPPAYADFNISIAPTTGADGVVTFDQLSQAFSGSASVTNTLTVVFSQDGAGNATLVVTINGTPATVTGPEPNVFATPQVQVGSGWTALGFCGTGQTLGSLPSGPPTPVKVVLTNVQQAIGVYTRDITDVNLMDPGFVEALTAALAYKLVVPLSGNVGMRKEFQLTAQQIIMEARAADSEAIAKVDHVPDFIQTRLVGGSPFGFGPSTGYGSNDGWGSWWGGYDSMSWGA